MDIRKILKDWMLPVAMTAGASGYLLYHYTPALHRFAPVLSALVNLLQPLFIFLMLFLTFCRIEPKDLKPHRWHWWLLLVQGGLFSLLGLLIHFLSELLPADVNSWTVLVESAMLCIICPTATAAAVVTRKLGGDVAGITTYTVLINFLAAILVPLIVPLIHPSDGTDFWTAFSMIMVKVFPLLILPCFSAWLVRYLFPRFHRRLLGYPDLAFYLWAFALALAIAVTVRSIMSSSLGGWLLVMIAAISLVCCVLQFAAGRYIGSLYRPRVRRSTVCDAPSPALQDYGTFSPQGLERGRNVRKITAGQALGQKNTVFAIWMGYTFMTPETSIVGGLYSIWHNLYNSWQLYRARKTDESGC